MRIPVRNIWDTHLCAVSSIVTAYDGAEVEFWTCGSYSQVTLEPPRLVINPNGIYPIEPAIRRTGRFALNVFSQAGQDVVGRVRRLRRRAANKERILGLRVARDAHHGVPYFADCLRTLFCEVEQILDTGDHTVVVGRVAETRVHAGDRGSRPILERDLLRAQDPHAALRRAVSVLAIRSGLKDAALKLLERRRGRRPANLAADTYELGGRTGAETAQILRSGVKDRGRLLEPPRAPAVLKRAVPLCVVGLGAWGSYHCQLWRRAEPRVELYVCGRDAQRARRLARAVGAKEVIADLGAATKDARLVALDLVLPHHMHASAAREALAAGKHVLVEKPIANSVEDADAMIGAARASGRILMVAENAHYRAAILAAWSEIQRGLIGEPTYMHVRAGGAMKNRGWKGDRAAMGGGILMDVGVHYVRAMRILMGEPERVLATKAMQIDTKMTGDDSTQVLFESGYGWQAGMFFNSVSAMGHGPDVILTGEAGTIQLFPAARFWTFYPSGGTPLLRAVSQLRPPWLAERLRRPWMERIRFPIVGDDVAGYLSEMRDFIRAIDAGEPPQTRAEDARRDLEIVRAAYASLDRGEWVRVSVPGGVAFPV